MVPETDFTFFSILNVLENWVSSVFMFVHWTKYLFMQNKSESTLYTFMVLEEVINKMAIPTFIWWWISVFYAFPIRKIISLVENKVTNIFRSPTHALEVFVVQLKMTIQQHPCSTVQLNVTLQSWIGTTSMFYNFCTEYTWECTMSIHNIRSKSNW